MREINSLCVKYHGRTVGTLAETKDLTDRMDRKSIWSQ